MRDNPAMDLEIAFAWAVNANTYFPMNDAYSSYTLVFGKNPSSPNIFSDKLPALSGITTSQSLAKHIKALYEIGLSTWRGVTQERNHTKQNVEVINNPETNCVAVPNTETVGDKVPAVQQNRSGNKFNYPRAGNIKKYRGRSPGGEAWRKAEVLGRGGKANSKSNKDYFNGRPSDNEPSLGVHLDKWNGKFTMQRVKKE